MKLESVQIPLSLSPLLSEILKYKTLTVNESGETLFLVPESWLVKVVQLVSENKNEKMNKMNPKNEILENEQGSVKLVYENQMFNPSLPKQILNVMAAENCNLLKAIMVFRGLSLKQVAQAYGGVSASANLSNFMARSNSELASMRPATARKIAAALGCPEAWLQVKASPDDRKGDFSASEFQDLNE